MGDRKQELYNVDRYENFYVFERAGLEKVWPGNTSAFVMMSSFSGTDYDENIQSHEKLKDSLKKLGLRYWEVDGHHTREKGERANIESELSVFVPLAADTPALEDLTPTAQELRDLFKQESLLYFSPDVGCILIYASEEISIGHPQNAAGLSSAYAELRLTQNSGLHYTIDGFRVPSNFVSAMGMNHEGSRF